MSKRTDLAVEKASEFEGSSNISGVNQQVYQEGDLEIIEIDIVTDEASEKFLKPKGKYLTIKAPLTFDNHIEDLESVVTTIVSLFSKVIPERENVLVVGLGNMDITPDSLGPMVSDHIFATRHIKMLDDEMDTEGLNTVSAIKTDVLGKTGIESGETVKAICDIISPSGVVAVDALACSELDHLGRTIQISNTGISPGSGVQNKRKELSENSLSVPVIAIGVPTVVDMQTISEHFFQREIENENAPNMMVTPRNIDKLIIRSSELISLSLNKFLNPSLSIEEIISLVK